MKKYIQKIKIMNMRKYIVAILSIFLLLILSVSFNTYFEKRAELSPSDEKERVQSYVVQCYATEGFYPPNLDYLSEHYGLILKDTEYLYFYDAFASNIRPDLSVSKQFNEGENVFENEL